MKSCSFNKVFISGNVRPPSNFGLTRPKCKKLLSLNLFTPSFCVMVTYFTCVFYIYFKPHSTLFGHYFYYSLFFLKSPFSFVYPHLFFMMIFILTCLSFYLGLFSFSWRTLIYFSARSAVNILSFCFLKPPSAFISFCNTYFELNSQTIYRPFTQSVQFNMPLILKDMFAEYEILGVDFQDITP